MPRSIFKSIVTKKFFLVMVVVFILFLYFSPEYHATNNSKEGFNQGGPLNPLSPIPAEIIIEQNGSLYRKISENIPDYLDTGKVSDYWLVWPEEDFQPIFMSLNPSVYFKTPLGSFSMVTISCLTASSEEFKEGQLVHFKFNPEEKAEVAYPFNPVIETALKKDLQLNMHQEAMIESVENNYQNKYKYLLSTWNDFTESTYLAESRDRFFSALSSIYHVPENVDLDPAKFFNREQRIALRQFGHQIQGTYHLYHGNERFTFILNNCPISQIVENINNSHPAGTEITNGIPKLKSENSLKDQEVNLSLEIENISVREVQQILQGILLGIEGIEIAE
ncbi:MAG: hypothetical protein ACLFPF_02965 [Halanaerobiales bacterium]